ncbi:methyltransferase domain-containing protein [Candidatus Nomurabacteria bacterium]|nr:methyltransferase domain-containing protein [Candidatus Nomurabacteria bacterium]
MVFTNRNPIFFLRILERFPCQCDWSKPVRKDLLTWLIICVLEPLLFQQIYLRVIWPYLINPFQLAFLSYDEAAKTADLKEGERVLVLGAGAVPHHIRWKRRLSARGWIVALDDNPYVLRDSRRIEALIEWLRGLLRLQRREVTKYVRADNLTLPFPDASFDAVIAIRCYVINVDEAKRVLKPGGRLVVICCGEVRGKDLHHQAGLQVTYDGFVLTI